LPFVREGDLHSRKHPCNGTCSSISLRGR
jgi:hypothetical protein